MIENEQDVLELLIRHELAIKRLYEIFAKMFVKNKVLWENLAADEQRHADWLSAIQPDSAVKSWLIRDCPLKIQAVKKSIDYVEIQIRKAEEGNFSILQALSVARDLENALLERQFSKLKSSSLEEFKAVIVKLSEETEKHMNAVVDVLKSEKKSGS